MKTIKTLLVAAVALVLTSQATSAQTARETALKPYNIGIVSFQTRNFSAFNTNGVALTYLHGFRFAPTVPFFFQTGLKLDMGYKHFDDAVADEGVLTDGATLRTFTFSVPLDLTYRIACGDNAVFAPYFGLSAKYHSHAKISAGNTVAPWEKDYKFDLFDAGMRHFQMGWHVGLSVEAYKFVFNTEFGTDIMAISEGGKYTPTFSIGLGYSF